MVYFQLGLICLTATREFQLTNLHVLSTSMLFHMVSCGDREKREKMIPSMLPL